MIYMSNRRCMFAGNLPLEQNQKTYVLNKYHMLNSTDAHKSHTHGFHGDHP